MAKKRRKADAILLDVEESYYRQEEENLYSQKLEHYEEQKSNSNNIRISPKKNEDDRTSSLSKASSSSLRNDFLLGFMLAIFFILFAVCLDGLHIVNIFRKRASRPSWQGQLTSSLQDGHDTAALENGLGLKFIHELEYQEIQENISRELNWLAQKKEEFDKAVKKIDSLSEEVVGLRQKHEELSKNFGLENWCGSCRFSSMSSCDQRLSYLKTKYNRSHLMAKIDLISLCNKSPSEAVDETSRDDKKSVGDLPTKEEEEEELEKGDEVKEVDEEKWCGFCTYKAGVTCDDYLDFLKRRYQRSDRDGKLELLPSCKMTSADAELTKKLDEWCGSCSYQPKVSCEDRVDYVKRKYGKTRREAMADLISDCMRPGKASNE